MEDHMSEELENKVIAVIRQYFDLPHTTGYQRYCAKEIIELIGKENTKFVEKLVCQDCGTTENVTETYCPYSHEIYDKLVQVVLCNNCYHERCMDI